MRHPTPRQRWLLRAACFFLVVYLLGLAGVPTLVPYLTAVLVVLVDGWRLLAAGRRRPDQGRGGA